MLRDAARYIPRVASARYTDSLWEVKTICRGARWMTVVDPRSGGAGSARPRDDIGAKIDSVYDVEEVVATMLKDRGT